VKDVDDGCIHLEQNAKSAPPLAERQFAQFDAEVGSFGSQRTSCRHRLQRLDSGE